MGDLPSSNNGRLIQLTPPRHLISDGVYQKFVQSKSIIKQREGETQGSEYQLYNSQGWCDVLTACCDLYYIPEMPVSRRFFKKVNISTEYNLPKSNIVKEVSCKTLLLFISILK